MTMQLRKAERKQSKLRIGMAGPSGSGKTYSALKMARGLVDSWDKIAMIDTENKRGDLYSHLGDYNIITLEAPFTPERFIEAIRACEKGGMEVIIIDSSSHEWDGSGGCLELNEKLAATKFKGNIWAAWSETTPRHQKFIEAIIASPCHIITTMRSKTDTIQTEDKKIKKVGLKEIQREGFEYELTVSFNIDRDNHYAIIGKDNTEIFKNTDPFIIDVEDGKKIRDWNESGKINTTEQKREIVRQLTRIGLQTTDGNQIKADIVDLTALDLVEENFTAIIEKLKVTPTIEEQIDESKEDEITAPTEPEKPITPIVEEETIKEPEEIEAPTLIGPAKINLLRTLGAQKEGLTDDKTFCGWLSFVHEIEVKKLEELNTVQATKIINSLLKQPNLTNEKDVEVEEEAKA